MIKFCIIGVAGFVAKKHLNCIKSLDGNLIGACDVHDNVGFIDSLFPEAKFFKDENLFFNFVKKNKPDYVVICSPSYLHYQHIRKSFFSKTNVIVEKPPVLSIKEYNKILLLEKKYKKKCFCIFQLRVNDKLKLLKNKISKSSKVNDVKISYTTYRGDWYFKTWKNDKLKSGGLGVNIGIHFFDILSWIFGEVVELKINKRSKSIMTGEMKLSKANVKWLLSVEKVKNDNKLQNYKFERYMLVNKKRYNFDKFNDLHKKNYEMIINNKGFHLRNFKNVIKLMDNLKK